MTPVTIKLPPNVRIIFNSLYRSMDPSYLTQDLLAIALPDGRRIDVGWYPEHDSSGCYTITVFNGSWESLQEQIETKDIDQVVERIETLAEKSSGPVDDHVNGIAKVGKQPV